MIHPTFVNDHRAKVILVVEDDYDIGDIVENYLKKSDFQVKRAMNGKQALDILGFSAIDLVILDVKLPVQSGWEVLTTLRQSKQTPVIMLTALDQEIDKVMALRIGADDFVVKPFNPNELVARVEAVLRRTTASMPQPLTHSIIRFKNIEINTENHCVSVKHISTVDASIATDESEDHFALKNVTLNLTLTEYKILLLMVNQPYKVFSRSELMLQCLPDRDALERTVDSHVSKLRKKLEDHQLYDLLINVRGVGYRLEQPQ
ncbi:two-component system response regulator AdeR [Acinetobacter calcoaceticus]|uniref:Two-component system response regulator AdeR n=1 Tax=Acinetobacter calcoaceticus TaxID=471 RepID=A0A4R1XV82_ACICA|nr:two-component system response regulator AdeR [Acinetobacter calcoaceticus]